MKRNIVIFIILFFLVTNIGSANGSSSVSNQNTWSSTIVVFNSEIREVDFTVQFYGSQGDSTIVSNPQTLNSFETRSYLIGSTSDNFGGAIVSSDYRLGVIYRSSKEVTKNPVFYTPFDITDAGYSFYIPEVLLKNDFKTRIGVQNAATYPISLTLTFYKPDGQSIVIKPEGKIETNKSMVFDTADAIFSEFGEDFAGSLVISADGKLVAVAEHIQVLGSGNLTYEGVSAGSPVAFAANVSCNFGSRSMSSLIIAQNTSPNAGEIFVDYYDQFGVLVSKQQSEIVQPFSSYQFHVCDPVENQGLSMAAVIWGESIAAVIKTTDGSGSMSAAYTAQAINDKSEHPNLRYRALIPFIEWSRSDSGYHTYISIMNVSDQPSTNAIISYYSPDGSNVTQVELSESANPIAPYAKRDLNPFVVPGLIRSENKDFMGSAVVLSDEPFSIIVRVQRDSVSPTGEIMTYGEDYSAIDHGVVWVDN